MPQLDKVTFLSQFFWLCLLYLGFYYIVLKYMLPKISRIITLRKKKMNLSQYGSLELQQENQQVRNNVDNTVSQSVSKSRTIFNDFFTKSLTWLNQSLNDVNKTQYKNVNNSYINYLGETSLSQKLLLSHTSQSAQSPETSEYKQVFALGQVVDTLKSLKNDSKHLETLKNKINEINNNPTVLKRKTKTPSTTPSQSTTPSPSTKPSPSTPKKSTPKKPSPQSPKTSTTKPKPPVQEQDDEKKRKK